MHNKNVRHLRERGLLTEQQLLTAAKFQANANRFFLAPTLFRILRELLILDVPLQEMEKRRGWSARSAKVVLSILLYALEETEGLYWSAPGSEQEAMASESMKAMMNSMIVSDVDEQVVGIMRTYGMSPMQAKIVVALLRAAPSHLTNEGIQFRIGAEDSSPASVYTTVCRIRADHPNFPYEIKTARGMTGYYIVPRHIEVADDARDTQVNAAVQNCTIRIAFTDGDRAGL